MILARSLSMATNKETITHFGIMHLGEASFVSTVVSGFSVMTTGLGSVASSVSAARASASVPTVNKVNAAIAENFSGGLKRIIINSGGSFSSGLAVT